MQERKQKRKCESVKVANVACDPEKCGTTFVATTALL